MLGAGKGGEIKSDLTEHRQCGLRAEAVDASQVHSRKTPQRSAQRLFSPPREVLLFAELGVGRNRPLGSLGGAELLQALDDLLGIALEHLLQVVVLL